MSATALTEDEKNIVTFEQFMTDTLIAIINRMMAKDDKKLADFKQHLDKFTLYFAERIPEIENKIIDEILVDFNERIEDITSQLSNNMVDLILLFKFIYIILNKFPFNSDYYFKFLEFFSSLGNKLLNRDPQNTEYYTEEYGVNTLCPLSNNKFKFKDVAILFMYYIPPNSNSYLRFIKTLNYQIKDKSFVIQFLSIMIWNQQEALKFEMNSELYNEYFNLSFRALSHCSPVTRTKGLMVLNFLCKTDCSPILKNLELIKKLVSDYYWEVRAQILQIMSQLLFALNTNLSKAINE